MAEVTKVTVTDEETRQVLESCLWGHMGDVISGGEFNGALYDEAQACAWHMVERGDPSAEAAFGARLAEIVDCRADVEAVRTAPTGSKVELHISTGCLADLLRGEIMDAIAGEGPFGKPAEVRQRLVTMYDTAERLVGELSEPAGAVA